MSERHTCCENVWARGAYNGYPCGKGASYEHKGKWFCKTHHPPTVQAKAEARQAQWQTEWEEKSARDKAAEEAAAEQKRKAEVYDQLAELNAELLEALVDVMFRHVPYTNKSDYAEKARAAIKKATEGTT